jgi:hypothetical protein
MSDSPADKAAQQHSLAIQHLQAVRNLREQGAADDQVAEVGRQQFRSAYDRELHALELLNGIETEPLKSDIYSTAALAALGLGQWDEAERLAREGLAGDAPERTRRELEGLIEAARGKKALF